MFQAKDFIQFFFLISAISSLIFNLDLSNALGFICVCYRYFYLLKCFDYYQIFYSSILQECHFHFLLILSPSSQTSPEKLYVEIADQVFQANLVSYSQYTLMAHSHGQVAVKLNMWKLVECRMGCTKETWESSCSAGSQNSQEKRILTMYVVYVPSHV